MRMGCVQRYAAFTDATEAGWWHVRAYGERQVNTDRKVHASSRASKYSTHGKRIRSGRSYQLGVMQPMGRQRGVAAHS